MLENYRDIILRVANIKGPSKIELPLSRKPVITLNISWEGILREGDNKRPKPTFLTTILAFYIERIWSPRQRL